MFSAYYALTLLDKVVVCLETEDWMFNRITLRHFVRKMDLRGRLSSVKTKTKYWL